MDIAVILLAVLAVVFVVFLVFTIYWRIKVIAMMEALAEAKGFKGNTQIFGKAILWTGTLGAMTVLAMPDKHVQRELKELREEVKALREELTRN